MKKPILMLAALNYLFIPSTSFAVSEDKNSIANYNTVDKTKVISSTFGLLASYNYDGTPIIIPTNVIPLIQNQPYGWVIALKTGKTNIKWQEEFTLPTKPITWGIDPVNASRIITNKGRTAITEQETYSNNGIIYNSWSVAEGDPKGQYTIRVFTENKLVGKFEFEVK